MDNASVGPNYLIPNLLVTCQLLQRVADGQEQWTASALARALAVPRTTCYRILQTLVRSEFIQGEEGRYSLGPGLVRLGLHTLEGMPIRRACVPILSRLSQTLQESTHLAILCGQQSLLLEVRDHPQASRVASRPGTLAYAHASATGKVMLAFLPAAERRSMLASLTLMSLTKDTITGKAKLRAHLDEVAREGYAMDDEEYIVGVRCLAVPVRNARNRVVAAIGVTASKRNLGARTRKTWLEQLQREADRLTAALPHA